LELFNQTPARDERMAGIEFARVAGELDQQGWAILPRLLPPAECAALRSLYGRAPLFRSRVVMSRHGEVFEYNYTTGLIHLPEGQQAETEDV